MRYTAGLLLGCFAGIGCSSRDYEIAYTQRVEEFREHAKFAVLKPEPERVLDGRLAVRIPRGFTALVDDAKPFEWLQKVSGAEKIAAGTVDVDGEAVAVTLVAAIVPKATADTERLLEDSFRKKLGDAGSAPTWRTPEAVPIAGGPRVWRVATFPVTENVEIRSQTGTAALTRDCTCECWVSADREQAGSVVLVWLVPTEAIDGFAVPFSEVANVVARTVAVSSPDAAE